MLIKPLDKIRKEKLIPEINLNGFITGLFKPEIIKQIITYFSIEPNCQETVRPKGLFT